MNEPRKHEVITATKLVVRVLQDVVSRDRFATYADLSEALKVRCRQLRITYDASLVSDAIDRLEMGGKTRIVTASRASAPSVEIVPEGRPCTVGEAAVLYRELLGRFTRERQPAVTAAPGTGAPEFFPSLMRVRS